MPVLGDGGPFTENSGRLEVILCAGKVVQLTVELGQSDVQVGRSPGVRRTARGGGLQRLLEQPAGAARPTRGDPHVGEHDRGVQLVDEVARGVQAADRVGERGQCLVDVAGGPGGQAEVAAAGTAHEVVLWSGQVQGVPGMAYGAGDIAACLRQRRSVNRDRRRRGAQILGVGPRCREVGVLGAGGQRGFGVVEPDPAASRSPDISSDQLDRMQRTGLRRTTGPGKDRTQVRSRPSCRVGRICGSASSIR